MRRNGGKIHAFSFLALGGGECLESCSGPFTTGIYFIDGAWIAKQLEWLTNTLRDPITAALFAMGGDIFTALQFSNLH